MAETPAPQSAAALSYDIVMATRNRPEAVELSLPLILAQTRPPKAVFIVDSSDDGAPIEALATAADKASPIPVHYIRSEIGSSYQRNVGIGRSDADVIVFPDDDSLLYPDAADEIMQIYEADTEGAIAGVAGHAVAQAPPETPGDLGAYEAEETGALRSALQRLRQGVKEAMGFANPFVSVGRRLARQHPRPDWLGARDVQIVPYMTGFRMSFRRAVIAPEGFDETLRKYGWFEDVDASYGAMRHGLVVTANRARIYHHRVAGARGDGRQIGRWAILNRGYVVMKTVRRNPDVFPRPGRESWRLRAYCRLRSLAYRLMARDAFSRARASGAQGGVQRLPDLLAAPADRLAAVYARLDTSA